MPANLSKTTAKRKPRHIGVAVTRAPVLQAQASPKATDLSPRSISNKISNIINKIADQALKLSELIFDLQNLLEDLNNSLINYHHNYASSSKYLDDPQIENYQTLTTLIVDLRYTMAYLSSLEDEMDITNNIEELQAIALNYQQHLQENTRFSYYLNSLINPDLKNDIARVLSYMDYILPQRLEKILQHNTQRILSSTPKDSCATSSLPHDAASVRSEHRFDPIMSFESSRKSLVHSSPPVQMNPISPSSVPLLPLPSSDGGIRYYPMKQQLDPHHYPKRNPENEEGSLATAAETETETEFLNEENLSIKNLMKSTKENLEKFFKPSGTIIQSDHANGGSLNYKISDELNSQEIMTATLDHKKLSFPDYALIPDLSKTMPNLQGQALICYLSSLINTYSSPLQVTLNFSSNYTTEDLNYIHQALELLSNDDPELGKLIKQCTLVKDQDNNIHSLSSYLEHKLNTPSTVEPTADHLMPPHHHSPRITSPLIKLKRKAKHTTDHLKNWQGNVTKVLREKLEYTQNKLESGFALAQGRLESGVAYAKNKLEHGLEHIKDGRTLGFKDALEAIKYGLQSANFGLERGLEHAKHGFAYAIGEVERGLEHELEYAKTKLEHGFKRATSELERKFASAKSELKLGLEYARRELKLGLEYTTNGIEHVLKDVKGELERRFNLAKGELERGLADATAELEHGLKNAKIGLERGLANAQPGFAQGLEYGLKYAKHTQAGLKRGTKYAQDRLKRGAKYFKGKLHPRTRFN